MTLLRSVRSMMPWISQQLRLDAGHAAVLASYSTDKSVATQQPSSVRPAADEQAGPRVAEEWTEVIDEKSGQPYYWNQKTGETTELGEPRPTSRFKDSHWEQAASSGPFQEGWREPHSRDLTYFYSMLGVGIGVMVGWASQYTH